MVQTGNTLLYSTLFTGLFRLGQKFTSAETTSYAFCRFLGTLTVIHTWESCPLILFSGMTSFFDIFPEVLIFDTCWINLCYLVPIFANIVRSGLGLFFICLLSTSVQLIWSFLKKKILSFVIFIIPIDHERFCIMYVLVNKLHLFPNISETLFVAVPTIWSNVNYYLMWSVCRIFDLSADIGQPEQEYYLQPGSSPNAAAIRPVEFSFGGDHLWDKFSVRGYSFTACLV